MAVSGREGTPDVSCSESWERSQRFPRTRRSPMRRAVRALLVGGVLLSAAAGCGTAKSSPNAAPAPGASAADPAQAATRSACEALGQVYTQKMAPFAEA